MHRLQGMGEPLANYEAVRDAVALMTDPRVFALARRQVTISTVGVIPRIRQLAEDLPVSKQQQQQQGVLGNATLNCWPLATAF
jgi:adenine C2-methylase RlmN of 23S rRNA A2503 and tRNA A37